MKEVVLFWNDEMELAENLTEMERESNNNNNVARRIFLQDESETHEKEVGTLGIEEYGDDYDEVMRKPEEKDDQNGVDGDYGDDVCPICLSSFTIPCRSNCGHLFCAACILQFWMYRDSIEACKCPLCCCRIVKLQPQIQSSQLSEELADDDGVDEVLNKVQKYNGLYISGVFGVLHIVEALPLLLGRILRVVVDPDCLRCIYYVLRVVGLFLGLLYEGAEFEFVPAGGLGIQRMLELVASLLVAALFLVGVVYRWLLKRRRATHLPPIDM